MRTTPGGHPILDFLPKCKVCERGHAVIVQGVTEKCSGYGPNERYDKVIQTRFECSFCRMQTPDFDGNEGFSKSVDAWTGQPQET